ncbi:hypothetical protein Tco_0614086 [Tanacetum coccineum]
MRYRALVQERADGTGPRRVIGRLVVGKQNSLEHGEVSEEGTIVCRISCFSVAFVQASKRYPKTYHQKRLNVSSDYIKGTMLRIMVPKGRSDIELLVYANSDHAGDYVDRKSTSGCMHVLICCLTSVVFEEATLLPTPQPKGWKYVSAGIGMSTSAMDETQLS